MASLIRRPAITAADEQAKGVELVCRSAETENLIDRPSPHRLKSLRDVFADGAVTDTAAGREALRNDLITSIQPMHGHDV